MSAIIRGLYAVATTLILVAPVLAQSTTSAVADQVPTTTLPWVTVSEFGVALTNWSAQPTLDSTAPTFTAPAFPGQARESQNVAMMIVGGAALVVGSVIGGDAGTLMMVGGGVVGLVGLYRYLQ